MENPQEKSTDLMQCLKCRFVWNPETRRRQDGAFKTSCPKCNSHSAILTHKILTKIQPREDLLMLTCGEYPQKHCPRTSLEEVKGIEVARLGSARLLLGRGIESPKYGHKISLFVDRILVMDSQFGERTSIIGAVAWCPQNARVFIGGLGLGIVLLYLAKSGKAKQVTVCEISKDVIALIEPRLRQWFNKHYPRFNWKVIQGDALKLVTNGKPYDWIFMDLWTRSSDYHAMIEAKAAAEKNLTSTGRVTCWMLDKYRKQERRFRAWKSLKQEREAKGFFDPLTDENGLIIFKRPEQEGGKKCARFERENP
jgi:hypothetical protein